MDLLDGEVLIHWHVIFFHCGIFSSFRMYHLDAARLLLEDSLCEFASHWNMKEQ